ncbi:MAG: cyanase [Rhodospirillum sp.]|nr:cyanase [Rhodospirillum sp.]MCF8490424.1 cyanase [Rhodospirillum sp.]MCF8500979.1 cyanase [Rhodospirillum sp.]
MLSTPAIGRAAVTEKIVAAKLAKDLNWTAIAEEIGGSKEWVTCALLGQMQLSTEQADKAAALFGLTPAEAKWLTKVPNRGGQPTVPTDPLLYRFYEIIQVYGPAMKELIEEEFGDGIMSAIDFSTDIKRAEDPKGDRVIVTLSGKFLHYKHY